MKPAARLFIASIRVAAALVRTRATAEIARRALGRIGDLLARRRAITPQPTPLAMAEAWQRAFPSRRAVPIISSDDTTAIAEIHTPCPLRGTGDVDACWRMMEYDRAFAARAGAGARFVVLQSQATGHTHCRVALRPATLPADDLVPAHNRT